MALPGRTGPTFGALPSGHMTPQMRSARLQTGKAGQLQTASLCRGAGANHLEYDSEEEMTKQTKDPRMKTSKKKAENFFTHANVKNKNQSRHIFKGNELGGSLR
ncbi:hypothetical protein DFH28DRAFT_929644 [Melampsora americana]|nr:hypothetical protein DFH28DRAFT_929644 [Melampsora americana]